MARVSSGVLESSFTIKKKPGQEARHTSTSTVPVQNRNKISDYEVPFTHQELIERWSQAINDQVEAMSDELFEIKGKIEEIEKRLGQEPKEETDPLADIKKNKKKTKQVDLPEIVEPPAEG